jgi:hypothetical protein
LEELIFHWGLEGYSAEIYRITENGTVRFPKCYSSMDMDENDDEIWRQGEFEYESFETFWKEFSDHPLWLRYRPIYIHKDYKPFLRDFFDNIPQGSLTMGEKLRFIIWLHKIE